MNEIQYRLKRGSLGQNDGEMIISWRRIKLIFLSKKVNPKTEVEHKNLWVHLKYYLKIKHEGNIK